MSSQRSLERSDSTGSNGSYLEKKPPRRTSVNELMQRLDHIKFSREMEYSSRGRHVQQRKIKGKNRATTRHYHHQQQPYIRSLSPKPKLSSAFLLKSPSSLSLSSSSSTRRKSWNFMDGMDLVDSSGQNNKENDDETGSVESFQSMGEFSIQSLPLSDRGDVIERARAYRRKRAARKRAQAEEESNKSVAFSHPRRLSNGNDNKSLSSSSHSRRFSNGSNNSNGEQQPRRRASLSHMPHHNNNVKHEQPPKQNIHRTEIVITTRDVVVAPQEDTMISVIHEDEASSVSSLHTSLSSEYRHSCQKRSKATFYNRTNEPRSNNNSKPFYFCEHCGCKVFGTTTHFCTCQTCQYNWRGCSECAQIYATDCFRCVNDEVTANQWTPLRCNTRRLCIQEQQSIGTSSTGESTDSQLNDGDEIVVENVR